MTLPHTWPVQQRLEKEAVKKLRYRMRRDWALRVVKTGLRPGEVAHRLKINHNFLSNILTSYGLSLTKGWMDARAAEAKERLRNPNAKRAAVTKEEPQGPAIDRMIEMAAKESALLKGGGMT